MVEMVYLIRDILSLDIFLMRCNKGTQTQRKINERKKRVELWGATIDAFLRNKHGKLPRKLCKSQHLN